MPDSVVSCARSAPERAKRATLVRAQITTESRKSDFTNVGRSPDVSKIAISETQSWVERRTSALDDKMTPKKSGKRQIPAHLHSYRPSECKALAHDWVGNCPKAGHQLSVSPKRDHFWLPEIWQKRSKIGKKSLKNQRNLSPCLENRIPNEK